ncbi:MAG: threonine/serine exporter family protein [Bacteroidales bacterium]|nr:threonine/serine exporter family protein [Bacteroidales bacterium]
MQTESNNGNEQRLQRKLDLLLQAGIVLLESAADTNRIVRNMKRIGAFLGFDDQHLHIDVLYGSISVNYSDVAHSFSKTAQTDKYTINMKALSAISKLSWRAIQKDYTMTMFAKELERIRRMKSDFPLWMVTLGAALGCGGFSVCFGGDWGSFLPATIAGLVGFAVRAMMLRERFNFYMLTALSAFVATLTAWAMSFLFEGLTETPYHPFLSCALFLVPGVALINFLDDMLDHYPTMGIARMALAIVQVASMTFGIVLAVQVCGVTDFLTTVSVRPDHPYWVYVVTTAISAMGFGMIFNVPRRVLPIVALCGVTAMCTRNFLAFDLDLGLIIGSLAGATLASLMAVRLVHTVHTPNHVITIPSVIPMVPGILMYRGVFGLVQTSTDIAILITSINNLITAGLIVLCISVGVAIPNIFARRWIAADRKIHLQKLIEERRSRGKFVNLSDFD